jgi:hypothetical protein
MAVCCRVDQYEEGKKAHTFGTNPKGQWIFGKDGRFAEILVGEPQPELMTKDPRRLHVGPLALGLEGLGVGGQILTYGAAIENLVPQCFLSCNLPGQ